MDELNEKIRKDNELGRGFEIGHSYFVPGEGDETSDAWYEHVVDTQIEPLLREYWFDSPTDVEATVARLKGNGPLESHPDPQRLLPPLLRVGTRSRAGHQAARLAGRAVVGA